MKIEIVSTETIPPSSPTPNDLSSYKFSFIDQLEVPAFMPLTLFYEATGSLTKSEISSRLKESLSKTLSLCYPLTGRIVDNSYVNDDKGVTYVEAQADCDLLEVIKQPNPLELVKLLPRNHDDVTDVCLIVQTTFFSCGGVAIGVVLSHKICDAWSLSLFVNSWAAISRGDDAHIRSLTFDGATLFPPRDLGGFDPKCWMKMTKEDLVTKRFIFTASKINELRDKYTNTSRATRIEALTAFIWTRFMASNQTKDDLNRKFNLVVPIDIRKRAAPPLSSELFGNFVQHAVPIFDGEEEGGTYNNGAIVVEKMREAIQRIDGDYVNKLREGSESVNISNDTVKEYTSGEVEPFAFTSLCRIPLYEADFGRGKPIWIGLGGSFHKNRVVFVDSVSSGGIEAWITFKSKDMSKFEADQEFLVYSAT